MLRREIFLVLIALFATTACVDDETPPVVVPDSDAGTNNSSSDMGTVADAGNNANNSSTDAGADDAGGDDAGTDAGDEWAAYTDLTDVTTRESCSLGGQAIYVAANLPSEFPDEASFTEESVYNVGTAPPIYRNEDDISFSVAWANTEGSNVHLVAGTAVVTTGSTTFESPVYFTFSLAPNVAVTSMTVRPAAFELGTDALYEVTLYTSQGVHKCEARQSTTDQSITQGCEPDTDFNDYVTSQSLAPIRRMETYPVLRDDGVFTYVTTDYVFAGNGGDSRYRLGAVRYNILLNSLGFPDIVAIQDTPFFERLVVGASTEANRAPYLMALVGEGTEAEPTVLTANEAITEYTTEDLEWSFLPEFEAQPGTFSFVSSIDFFVEAEQLVGPRLNTDATDASFGYVAVLSDGSLGFSRPGGFGENDFLRWNTPEPMQNIWAFDNYAWKQSPGHPIILARGESGELYVIRWDLDDAIDTIPNVLGGAGVDSVLEARGTALVNHDGVFALKVVRGGSPDLAILPLQSVRDFTDFICN